jgi:hypothetical protein
METIVFALLGNVSRKIVKKATTYIKLQRCEVLDTEYFLQLIEKVGAQHSYRAFRIVRGRATFKIQRVQGV